MAAPPLPGILAPQAREASPRPDQPSRRAARTTGTSATRLARPLPGIRSGLSLGEALRSFPQVAGERQANKARAGQERRLPLLPRRGNPTRPRKRFRRGGSPSELPTVRPGSRGKAGAPRGKAPLSAPLSPRGRGPGGSSGRPAPSASTPAARGGGGSGGRRKKGGSEASRRGGARPRRSAPITAPGSHVGSSRSDWGLAEGAGSVPEPRRGLAGPAPFVPWLPRAAEFGPRPPF